MAVSTGSFELYDPEEWREQAACVSSPSAHFFPPPDALADEARGVCATCSVRLECTAFALATRPAYGIWGGLDTEELAALRSAHSRPELLILGPDAELGELLEGIPRSEADLRG